MKKTKLSLTLTAATGAVLFLSGLTTSNAADSRRAVELRLDPQQLSASADIEGDTDGIYLVRLADPAIATYEGGINGFSPTSAKSTGKQRLDTKSTAAKKYKGLLEQKQGKVLDGASSAFGRKLEPVYTYKYATNGFAVLLTADEAKAMRSMTGVVSVQREQMETLLTDAGPSWIGAPGIWNNKPAGTKGEGVVVAILDSGINSDHPSFADVGDDGYNHKNPLGSGTYIPGSYCDVTDSGFCNDKLIGAWDFDTTDGPNPEDEDGHGSHTASTVAGNVVNDAVIDAPTTSASFDISGVAPHANIIAYDVCHWTPTGGTCPGSALAAAIDQVLIDAGELPKGIAALNYSISGGGNPYNDYVELGFLAAVDAGVYVAASAGNSGPAASTVAHLGPWVSTTAASTHNRQVVNSLIDLTSSGGDEADIRGLGLTSGYGPAPIINSADLEGTYPGATLCGQGPDDGDTSPFPANTFNGEIVACTRGTYGRVEKGANVLAAGAGGMVLLDNGAGLVGDAHVLPAVHISVADSATLTAWLAANAGNDPMASIEGWYFDRDAANGDVMAGFSSRGPQLVFDVLKPDITAPGVDIMGADADLFAQYQIISGTSMSSPHNAGSGALMTALRPDLSPPEIKSALMMSSSTEFMVKEDRVTPADAFDHGAGRIDLYAAKSAGLVMHETTANFEAANPALGGDPSTLNVASMMSSNCVGTCSWTRTVRNTEKSTSHWSVTASGDGFGAEVVVSPEADSDDYNLMLKKGESATVTVTADTALLEDGWYFGQVDLDRNLDKGPDLHMPIAVYASKATDAQLFTKTVDLATAVPGDTLTYEINVTNGPLRDPITVVDTIPAGTTFVADSETESVVNGSTTSPWTYDADTNSLSWTGDLDAGGLDVSPAAAPFGYLPLSSLGVPPGSKPANCDDGAFGYTVPAFTYNGATYTRLVRSVNGTLEPRSSGGSATGGFNRNMPDATAPNNLIAPLWTDLNLCTGGAWRVAVLNFVFPAQYTVWDWENVPLFGDLSRRYNFQMWVENNVSGAPAIWFTYGPVGLPLPNMTVGAENSDATNGYAYYYNGSGTPPAPGVDLEVQTLEGGTATLGFQVVTDCSDTTINEANLSSEGKDERAIAVTACP